MEASHDILMLTHAEGGIDATRYSIIAAYSPNTTAH
jgi:hypothetical protein